MIQLLQLFDPAELTAGEGYILIALFSIAAWMDRRLRKVETGLAYLNGMEREKKGGE